MAHGLESRVPLLDHPLVEFAATMPADVKFKDGHDEARASRRRSRTIAAGRRSSTRKDKMGFPVPLHEWIAPGPARDFVARHALVGRGRSSRELVDNAQRARRARRASTRFGRKSGGCSASSSGSSAFHDQRARVPRSCSTTKETVLA